MILKRKRRRNEMSFENILTQKNVKILLLVILIIIPTYIAFIYFSLTPGVNSNLHFEDKMYYSKKVSNNVTTITIIAYITNEGISDSGDVRLKVFVEDQEGISQSVGEKDVGVIPSHKTEEVEIDVEVPDSLRYDVDALLFEDDERIITGRGDFTAPTASDPEAKSGGDFSPYEERDEDAKAEFGAPGFEAMVIIMAFLFFIVYPRRRDKLKK
jgi:hypothetical protein